MGVHLPGPPIPVQALFGDQEPPLSRSQLLRPPDRRRHVGREVRAAEMIEQATRDLFSRLGREVHVDVMLTNVLLPDNPITGSGAEAAARLNVSPTTILDVHNGGCGSFPFMLDIADRLLDGSDAHAALICNVQNTAGKVFSQETIRLRRHAVAAGDGCGVALVMRDKGSPVLGTAVLHDPTSAADMGLELTDGRLYWEPGTSEIDITFDEARTEEIIARGNRSVPAAVRAVLIQVGLGVADVNLLITNQPNRIFLQNWREELGIAAERHFDTFDDLGNLYGAATPVGLAQAARAGRLADGDVVVLAGFAHAGDFSAASVVRWHDPPPHTPV